MNLSALVSSPKFAGVKGALFNDWQFAPLIGWRTGSVITILTGVDTALQGTTTSFKDRPNQVGDPYSGPCANGAALGARDCFFNPAAYSAPASGTFGNVRRNSLNGPSALTFNTSVTRKIGLGESRSLQLRFETFNLLNHPNLGNPNSSLNSANVGRILSQNGDGRTFQAALKFAF
jgi:hypothetical protein